MRSSRESSDGVRLRRWMLDCRADDQKATGLADRPSGGRKSLCNDTEVKRKTGIVSGLQGVQDEAVCGQVWL
jgi:hypothetical protein